MGTSALSRGDLVDMKCLRSAPSRASCLFCTPGHGRPDIGTEHKAREEPQIYQELLQHMLSIIKFYYAYAAGDEQVAGQRLMSGAPKEMDDSACQCKWMWFD